MKGKIGSLILKVLLGGIILFLVVVAFKDFTPEQKPVEKTVVYENR